MNIIEIIEKKRDGEMLSKEEIAFFIDAYVNDKIEDYQASALLMAICIRGMNNSELFALTDAMLHSGEILDLSDIKGYKVDKHSTGGVGDKTSLVLGPILAACGLSFAKMSGRGLSHTGGTLDKLESISGFQVSLAKEDFVKQVNVCGISIIGQSEKLVPADKKLYALRDVSGSVPSIPLIASSIMSKKLASGADYILLDVKYGDGAFMATKEEAEVLARTMIAIGNAFHKTVRAEITSMEEPLGNAIGNALEVKEAILALQNQGPEDLISLCESSAVTLLQMTGVYDNKIEALQKVREVIENGEAFKKFVEMCKWQNGDLLEVKYPEKMKKSKYVISVKAEQNGFINAIKTRKLGLLACELGAGRKTKEDSVIKEVGIMLHKKHSDAVTKGDILCELHANELLSNTFLEEVRSCFTIGEKKEKAPLLYKTL